MMTRRARCPARPLTVNRLSALGACQAAAIAGSASSAAAAAAEPRKTGALFIAQLPMLRGHTMTMRRSHH